MRIMKNSLACLLASLALTSAAAAADPEPSHPVVVELFTSQGCSSCPPADAYLGELAQQDGVVALGWHVSYWDYIGWKDPFATEAFTQRQRDYSRFMGERMVYTPQIVVDGETHAVGSDRDAVQRLIATARTTAKVAIAVTPKDGGWTVAVGAGPEEPSDLLWVRYLPESSNPVRAGENRGRELRNFNIVRAATRLGEWRGATETFAAPADDAEAAARFRQLQLLTGKPVLYVCNVDEDAAADGNAHTRAVAEAAAGEEAVSVVVSAAIEAEVAQLSDAEEKAAFLAELGLGETGLTRVVNAGYRLLDLLTFFTVGPKEARAWTAPRGATAANCAGVIHTDFERGFIAAETIAYDDFVAAGGEAGAKEAGKMRLEGRDYAAQDGDVFHFRFNV